MSRIPPDCGAEAATSLRCAACAATFPIQNGVPRLWPPSRATEIQASLAAFHDAHQAVRGSRFFRALLPPNPICDPGARRRTARVKEAMAGGLVLNLGSKDTAWGEHVVNVDLVLPQFNIQNEKCKIEHTGAGNQEPRANSQQPRAKSTLLLADMHRLPFADASVDGVICTSVLEHVADAHTCLDEIARVVKPGGHVYVTVPFLFPTHPDPLDRWRWTLDGLRHALRGFDELDAGVCGGPCSAFVAIVPTLKASVFSNFYLFNCVRCVAGWVLWPVKFLDYIACRSRKAHMAAAAFYFLGRKKAGA
ncbi:MAG: class I SAM-dependent methyltransferase [Planctomycetota bacterium]|nr:class I SAM-dependent methyltransferase [Planctomycetota bacterium]